MTSLSSYEDLGSCVKVQSSSGKFQFLHGDTASSFLIYVSAMRYCFSDQSEKYRMAIHEEIEQLFSFDVSPSERDLIAEKQREREINNKEASLSDLKDERRVLVDNQNFLKKMKHNLQRDLNAIEYDCNKHNNSSGSDILLGYTGVASAVVTGGIMPLFVAFGTMAIKHFANDSTNKNLQQRKKQIKEQMNNCDKEIQATEQRIKDLDKIIKLREIS